MEELIMANEFMGASPEELQKAMKALQEAMRAAGVDPNKVMGDSNKPRSDENVPKSTGKKAYKTTEKVITPRYSNILTPEGETNFENTATTKVRNLRITDDYVQFAEKALKKYKKDEAKLREAFAENNFYYIPGVTEKIVAHRKSVDEFNAIKDLQKKAAQDKEKLRRQLIKNNEFGTRKFVNAMADADKEIYHSYDDHRIAMALTAADMETDDYSCIKKSYPNFIEQWSKWQILNAQTIIPTNRLDKTGSNYVFDEGKGKKYALHKGIANASSYYV